MRATAADDLEVLARRPDGRPEIARRTHAVRSDPVGHVADHPPPNRISVSWSDAGVADRPVVAAFDHRDAQTIAGLRIDAALRQSSRNDAAGGAAAEPEDVVVVLAVARLDSRSRRGPFGIERDQVAFEPVVRRLLRLLAERLFLFPRRLTGESGDVPTRDDVLGVRVGDLMGVARL